MLSNQLREYVTNSRICDSSRLRTSLSWQKVTVCLLCQLLVSNCGLFHTTDVHAFVHGMKLCMVIGIANLLTAFRVIIMWFCWHKFVASIVYLHVTGSALLESVNSVFIKMCTINLSEQLNYSLKVLSAGHTINYIYRTCKQQDVSVRYVVLYDELLLLHCIALFLPKW